MRKYIGVEVGRQVATAEKIAAAMTKEGIALNTSHSFQVFLKTLALF